MGSTLSETAKVETFQTQHELPISSCFDLTGVTLQGWQPSVEEPLVKVSLNLEVFPMDKDTSDRLEQYKRHLALEYASKDKIVETDVIFSVNGHKTLIAGKGSVTITAYDPRFEDEARSGWCCFNWPGVKKAKITVIKKFQVDLLHISCGQRSLTGRSPPPQPTSLCTPTPSCWTSRTCSCRTFPVSSACPVSATNPILPTGSPLLRSSESTRTVSLPHPWKRQPNLGPTSSFLLPTLI